MMLFVGIDVSSQDIKACVMNLDEEVLTSLTVENNLPAASYLRVQVVDIDQNHMIQEIQVGMEATSVYSWHPAMFFHKDESLKKFKTKVFTINPKLFKKFKVSYADLDKTGHVDVSTRVGGRWKNRIVNQPKPLCIFQ
jgi:hypothetical protein